MKNLFIAFLLSALSIQAFAQNENEPVIQQPVQELPESDGIRQGVSPSTGDLYYGLTRKIMYDRMIPPHGIEVTFDKTVHLIFPSPVVYVDLGSANIVAGKADGVDNILRVKAAVRDFSTETNFSVVTDEGSFYSFSAHVM